MLIRIRLLAHIHYVYPHKVIGICLLCLSTLGHWHMCIMFIHKRLLAHVHYVYPHKVIGTCLLYLST